MILTQDMLVLLHAIQGEKDVSAIHALADLLVEKNDAGIIVEVLSTLVNLPDQNALREMTWNDFVDLPYQHIPPLVVLNLSERLTYYLERFYRGNSRKRCSGNQQERISSSSFRSRKANDQASGKVSRSFRANLEGGLSMISLTLKQVAQAFHEGDESARGPLHDLMCEHGFPLLAYAHLISGCVEMSDYGIIGYGVPCRGKDCLIVRKIIEGDEEYLMYWENVRKGSST